MPEPGTHLLLAVGMIGIAGHRACLESRDRSENLNSYSCSFPSRKSNSGIETYFSLNITMIGSLIFANGITIQEEFIMMTEICETVYEILWVKISKAVAIDGYRLPGSFQRTNASGRIITIGAWIIPDTNDPHPKQGGWMLLSHGLNGLIWIHRVTNCKPVPETLLIRKTPETAVALLSNMNELTDAG